MITGEMSWAWIALSFAWAGSGIWPFDGSHLHQVLDRRGLDEIWALFVGLPAAALLYFSSREWVAHCAARNGFAAAWSVIENARSAKWRARLCMTLTFSWMYVFYALVSAHNNKPSALIPVALGGVVFMLMFWLENRRVQRDIRKSSSIDSAG